MSKHQHTDKAAQQKPIHAGCRGVFSALILLFGAIAMVLLIPEAGSNPFAGVQAVIVDTASWFYVLIVSLIAVIVAFLAFSRYGDIKLVPTTQIRIQLLSWFAMLFSAGIGIGMMFYGIAEPVMHYLSPPTGPGGTPAAATEGYPDQLFPLGLQCLGDLRGGCDDSGVFRLPPRPAADSALSFLSADWRTHLRPCWRRGRCVRGDLHDLRYLGQPRLGRIADQHGL